MEKQKEIGAGVRDSGFPRWAACTWLACRHGPIPRFLYSPFWPCRIWPSSPHHQRKQIGESQHVKLKLKLPITAAVVAFVQCCLVPVASVRAQSNTIAIFPDEDPVAPGNLRLVWPAKPSVRYEVQQSTNLQAWATAPGFPAVANGPAQQMPFETVGAARFFRVRELDEQPRAVISRYPKPDFILLAAR
jgi:hypothetical protein